MIDMKRIVILLLFAVTIVCGSVELCAFGQVPNNSELNDDDDELTEDEFLILDSIRILGDVKTKQTGDSIMDVIRRKRALSESVPFSYETKYYIAENTSKSDDIHNILIICEHDIYSVLNGEVIRYAQDIHSVYGCGIRVCVCKGGTPADIKKLLQDYYNALSISGALFVGDIPVAYFRQGNDSWPCDLYYMDMDGIWEAHAQRGFFDVHKGDRAPEIFVGRICAANFANRNQRIKDFFDKNHAFWTGKTKLKKQKVLSMTGPDWEDFREFRNGVKKLYGKDYATNVVGNNFTKSNYVSYIQNTDYEFIQLACHSNVTLHAFQKNETQNLTTAELDQINKRTIGYNLFCCRSCNWDNEFYYKCIGESYLYSASDALVVVGSTKSGGMLGFKSFYKSLGDNNCVGEAYKVWWNKYASVKRTEEQRISWWYGMCILGDPMIQFQYESQCPINQFVSMLDIDKRLNCQIYSAQNKITAASLVVAEGKELCLSANSIFLRPGFYVLAGASFKATVDPCYTASSAPPRKKYNIIEDEEIFENEKDPSFEKMETYLCKKHIVLYPNPCSTSFVIGSTMFDRFSYKVYSVDGELMLTGSVWETTEVDVSILPRGTYIVVCEANSILYRQSVKIIVQ